MKRIVTNLLIVLGICMFVFICLLPFGFKFMYAPTLENDWQAIGAIATCFAAILAAIVAWSVGQAQKRASMYSERMKTFKHIVSIYRITSPLELPYIISKNNLDYLYKVRDDIIEAEKVMSIEAQKIALLFNNEKNLEKVVRDIYQKTTLFMQQYIEYISTFEKNIEIAKTEGLQNILPTTDMTLNLDRLSKEIMVLLEKDLDIDTFKKYLII